MSWFDKVVFRGEDKPEGALKTKVEHLLMYTEPVFEELINVDEHCIATTEYYYDQESFKYYNITVTYCVSDEDNECFTDGILRECTPIAFRNKGED